jgi:hypothetical protein
MTETDLLSTPEFQRNYQKYLGTWLHTGAPDDDYYLEGVREGITLLYKELGIEHVQIVICAGPLELSVFPPIVELLLKLGSSAAQDFKFEHLVGEPKNVRDEWDGFCRSALSQINWDNAPADLGVLIESRVQDSITKPLLSRLTAEIDIDLDTVHHQMLERRFRTDLRLMLLRFSDALMFNRETRDHLWYSLVNRVPPRLRQLLGKNVIDSEEAKRLRLRGPVGRASAPRLHPGNLQEHLTGNLDWGWLASIDFARKHLKCKLPDAMSYHLDMWMRLALGATGYLFFSNCCFVYLRPIEAFFDERVRLHHEKKAAAQFVDGSALYFWHGIEVEDFVITKPEQISVKMIEKERNIEVRRILIERYGFENYVRHGAFRKIQEDDFGALFYKDQHDDEPLMILRVVNSTPEPDGSYKKYFLRVPPEVSTAREAVAWTFGMEPDDYGPEKET